ncbi:putative quinol monooxygenase [Myxococcus sp. RHSTA-1-4]|uniref:putative quinol monooxygenase n=1 Tax=Myxococcus sp. RHSTA-1-4 TaxID=2874601 RepID=UPI001CBD0511|nr:putative quinol monooxygenase [Myxococcus sp. RHSTA-1-4]MBZ4415817.1 antibiotic biosynthesis monooxygenase [Myxococcus sp. RHSTA-1-4]
MRVAIAVLEARPEAVETVEHALRALVEPTSREAGAVTYVVHRDSKRSTRFVVYERYVDRDALERHMSAPWLTGAVGALQAHLASPPAVEFLDELAAFDRPAR